LQSPSSAKRHSGISILKNIYYPPTDGGIRAVGCSLNFCCKSSGGRNGNAGRGFPCSIVQIRKVRRGKYLNRDEPELKLEINVGFPETESLFNECVFIRLFFFIVVLIIFKYFLGNPDDF